MLYREIIAVCSEIHTKHINTLCGQNVEFVSAKSGGTYSNQWAFIFNWKLQITNSGNEKTYLTRHSMNV